MDTTNNLKLCPHCGGSSFKAIVKRAGIVQSDGVDDDGNMKFKILKENTNSFDVQLIGCAECNAELTDKDLCGGVQCAHCGKFVNPNEVDENGYCSVCSMLMTNPELQNASQADLLQLLAKAYRGINPLINNIDNKIKQGEETTEKLATIADDILNGEENSSELTSEKPKQRRRAVKRKQNNVEEQLENKTESSQETSSQTPLEAAQSNDKSQEGNNMPTDTNDDERALMNTQDAPFPDVSETVEQLSNSSSDSDFMPFVESSQNQNNDDFEMFDKGEILPF